MTNFEKWKEEILKIKADDYEIAVRNGVPIPCIGICNQCEFEGGSPCIAKFVDWLLAEYQEPAPKLTKREREFLEAFDFRDKNVIYKTDVAGLLRLHILSVYGEKFEARLNQKMFPFIKQGETWAFKDLLELEVEDEH